MNENIENERGLSLGITIILLIVAFNIVLSFLNLKPGPLEEGPGTIVVGIYIQFLGILFLLSYYFSHKTFFFRWIIWLCEKFSYPASRKMAFFYFGLAFILGTTAILKGLGI